MQIITEFDKRQGRVRANDNIKDEDCREDCVVFGAMLKEQY